MESWRRWWRTAIFVRALAALGVLAAGFLAFRIVAETRHLHERGRYVRALANQVQKTLTADPVNAEAALAGPWPDDFLQLESWLILQVARGEAPAEILKSLERLSRQQHSLSASMRVSLARWSHTLLQWSEESPTLDPLPGRQPAGRGQVAQDALGRGRLRYLEARGYSEIGRQYDAAVLYLWAAAWLHRSIELANTDTGYPEALYLLGQTYMMLRNLRISLVVGC